MPALPGRSSRVQANQGSAAPTEPNRRPPQYRCRSPHPLPAARVTTRFVQPGYGSALRAEAGEEPQPRLRWRRVYAEQLAVPDRRQHVARLGSAFANSVLRADDAPARVIRPPARADRLRRPPARNRSLDPPEAWYHARPRVLQ